MTARVEENTAGTMKCSEFKEALDEEGRPTTPEAEQHVEECEACAELTGADGRVARRMLAADRGDAAPGSGPSFEQLSDEIEASDGIGERIREMSRGLRTGIVMLAAVIVAGAVFGLSPRPDLAEYPPGRFWGLAGGFLGVFALGVYEGFRPIYRSRPSRWRTGVSFLCVVGYGAVVALLPPAHTVEPFIDIGAGSDLVPIAAMCFGYGAAYALPVALFGWLAVRSSGVLLDRAALLTGAAGVVGVLGLHLSCPVVNLPHLMLGHATVPVGYLAISAGLVYLFAGPGGSS